MRESFFARKENRLRSASNEPDINCVSQFATDYDRTLELRESAAALESARWAFRAGP